MSIKQCFTSFHLSNPDGRIPIKKMDCDTALDLIQEIGLANSNTVPRLNYVSYVNIFKRFGLLESSQKDYDTLSHGKFKCYLECANESESDLEQRKCAKKCRELVEPVVLNSEDRSERSNSISNYAILRKHLEKQFLQK